jgi:hypothetical protein
LEDGAVPSAMFDSSEFCEITQSQLKSRCIIAWHGVGERKYSPCPPIRVIEIIA